MRHKMYVEDSDGFAELPVGDAGELRFAERDPVLGKTWIDTGGLLPKTQEPVRVKGPRDRR